MSANKFILKIKLKNKHLSSITFSYLQTKIGIIKKKKRNRSILLDINESTARNSEKLDV